jgi:hypothetical protein
MGKVNMNVIIAKSMAMNIGARVKMKKTGREGVLVGICMDEYSQDLWDAVVLLDGDDLIDQYDIDEVCLLLNTGSHPKEYELTDEIGFVPREFFVSYEAGGHFHKHSSKVLGFSEIIN